MPEGPTTPVEAFGNAITALVSGTADGGSDVRHGRDIVRILEQAERALAS